jgi:hypothetical protein
MTGFSNVAAPNSGAHTESLLSSHTHALLHCDMRYRIQVAVGVSILEAHGHHKPLI